MPVKISPFAPKKVKKITLMDGISVSITHCGLKKNNKDDLVLITLDNPGNIIGAFTRSKTPGEPIVWNKSIIDYGKVSAILINSGNANVFNGKSGKRSLLQIVKYLSDKLNIPDREVYIASTGVIGEPLDEKKIINKIPYLINNLKNDSESWCLAAKAIMTTDTYPKIHSEKFYDEQNFIINGIAKGSGMIAPNMATMLAFIFTNFDITKSMKKKFKEIVDKTFNSITIDGDTSTSDMVLLFSLKQAKTRKKNKDHRIFLNKLENIMNKLSELIVKDGEGASKFITINICGAKNQSDAKNVGISIANSPLFKTAMAGSDANWGRIIMAIGKSNAFIDPLKISLSFGSLVVLKNGKEFISKNVKLIDKYLRNKEIQITVNLGLGKYKWIVRTCDFTNKYISINTDYRS